MFYTLMTTPPDTVAQEIKNILRPHQVEMFKEVSSIEMVSPSAYGKLVQFVKAAATFSPEQAEKFSSLLVSLTADLPESAPQTPNVKKPENGKVHS